jgi:hypothetical protein
VNQWHPSEVADLRLHQPKTEDISGYRCSHTLIGTDENYLLHFDHHRANIGKDDLINRVSLKRLFDIFNPAQDSPHLNYFGELSSEMCRCLATLTDAACPSQIGERPNVNPQFRP